MSDLERLSERIGLLSWIAGELFALEGEWAASMQSAAAVEHLAEHSRHHGWHATLWRDALPDSAVLDARRHVAASAGWAAATNAARATVPGDPARLGVLYRGLVPRLVAELTALGGDLTGPAHAALRRTHGLVMPDVIADLSGGVTLLAATLGDQPAIESANRAVLALDQGFQS